MRFISLLLALSAALLPMTAPAWADSDAPASKKRQLQPHKGKERDVRKAASRKKRELREMGVRNVRVKTPGDWPRKVSVPKETTLQELPVEDGRSGVMYESNNYRYYSPGKLTHDAQKTLSRLCECAQAANRAIGSVLPVPRATAERGDKKFVVILQPSRQDYLAAGGPRNSAGVFMGRLRAGKNPPREEDIMMDCVMIPYESLGLNRAGAVQNADIDTHALVHELTHQQFLLNNLPIWANEGWAEYVGYVPYVGEDLDFERGFSLILHTAIKRASVDALDFDFKLEDFLTMDQQTMYGYMEQRKDTYTLAAMAVAFFVHLDGKRGVEAMKAYLQAILDGKSAEEARDVLIEPYYSAARLQQTFTRAWRGKKVKVSFPKK